MASMRRKKNSNIYEKGTAHSLEASNGKSLFQHLFPPNKENDDKARTGDTSCSNVVGGLGNAVIAAHNDIKGFTLISKGKVIAIVLVALAVTSAVATVTMAPSLPLATQSSRHSRRVVVSLSTTPTRLPYIFPTLESILMKQSKSPDAVYLTLPRFKYYSQTSNQKSGNSTSKAIAFADDKMPEFISKLKENHKIIILQPDFDYGPITKVLYALEAEQTKMKRKDSILIYLDDDVTYDSQLVERLSEYHTRVQPNFVVASSGAVLRSNFRQIKHTNERLNKPPNLYFSVGFDTNAQSQEAFSEEENMRRVDVVQGFAGVCISSSMINFTRLLQFMQTDKLPPEVFKSDDFILSAMMEANSIGRVLLPSDYHPKGKAQAFSNTVPVNGTIAGMDKLSAGMHRHAIVAAQFLQKTLGIWGDKKFLDWSALSSDKQDAINCEASHEQDCTKTDECLANDRKCPKARDALKDLV